MPSDRSYSPPFDEQAALAELERLRDAIQESRRRRSESSDEFDAFVRSFRAPAASESPAADAQRSRSAVVGRERHPAPPPVVPPAQSRVPPVEQRLHVEQGAPIEQSSSVQPPIVAGQPAAVGENEPDRPPVPEPTDPAGRTDATDRVPVSTRARSILPRVLGAAAILVVGLVLLVRPWKAARPDTASTVATGGAATTASAPAITTPPPAGAAAAPAAAPAMGAHALEGELNVQRRVWVRVLLDGQRTVEREVPAGTRIPLQAERAIVIRSGDAGALRVTINGVNRGPLGKDAEIVTRTFTAQQ